MADCKSYDYPGWGTFARPAFHYSQAIRVGDRIHCAGQGGWDAHQKEFDLATMMPNDLVKEIDAAFANCDLNLRHAGGKGWSQVYRIVTYSTDIKSQHEHIIRNLKKWCPDHAPVWTELGVKELGADGMHIEIDVDAYDPEGAKAAASKA